MHGPDAAGPIERHRQGRAAEAEQPHGDPLPNKSSWPRTEVEHQRRPGRRSRPKAQYERRLIGSRVREAMAQTKARGVRLGQPVEHSAAMRALVVELREGGATLQAIADRLTAEGVATPRGGRWYPASVRGILVSAELDLVASDARDRIALRSCWRWRPLRPRLIKRC